MRNLKITKRYSQRKEDSLERYLQEIQKIPQITPQEEVLLAKRIRQGDEKAFDTLVKSNLRFVISVAKQYQNKNLPLIDLINEGNLGLIKAARRFDETRGFKFISYAVWWIRQSIISALSEQGRTVKLPSNQIKSIRKLNEAFNFLEQELERNPTAEEIGVFLKTSIKKTQETLTLILSQNSTSIDEPIVANTENSFCLIDFIAAGEEFSPERQLLKDSLCDQINYIMRKKLSEKEQKVLKLYFGIGFERPKTLEEISAIFNCTKENIRLIEKRAIRKLKKYEKILKNYLL